MLALPEKAGPAREAAILADVREKRHEPVAWSSIRTEARGRVGVLYVMSDALRIGGVRVNVSATTAQQIADELGAMLPTAKVVDTAWEQAAIRCRPALRKPDARMADTSAMVAHSEAIDAQVKGRSGLVRTVGKDWILHHRLVGKANLACNYGWHDAKALYTSWSGLKVWQPVGTAHDRHHTDYSQTCSLMRDTMLVDGVTVPVAEVLRDPNLAELVNYEGVLTIARMPGVPPPSAPSAPIAKAREVPEVRTPLSEGDLIDALRIGHSAAFGAPPSPERLGVAWAQIALETGRGKICRNNNLGNITKPKAWIGEYYVLKVPPPDPPTLKFCAYDSPAAGATHYWTLLHDRFKSALSSFDSGDAAIAAAELGRLHYFLADVGQYSKGMSSLYAEAVRRGLVH